MVQLKEGQGSQQWRYTGDSRPWALGQEEDPGVSSNFAKICVNWRSKYLLVKTVTFCVTLEHVFYSYSTVC